MPASPAACDSVLAIDIGNTRIGLAVWDDDGLRGARRVSTTDESGWADALRGAWGELRGAHRRAVVVSSVVPTATRRVADMVSATLEVDPHIVREDVPLPLPLEIEGVDQVGADRVCSAAAAFDRIQGVCAVASFGTAITIDCVSEAGKFLGGAILPGLSMSARALRAETAQLPQIELVAPSAPFGGTTAAAITNGIVFGAVGAMREIVERFAVELNCWPYLIITGGDAPLIAQHAPFVDSHVPDLCLIGVALAYRKASTAGARNP